MTTLGEVFKQYVKKLADKDIENSENECRFILKKVLDITDVDFIINRDIDIGESEESQISDMINRRIGGEPIQYIIGEWDFMDSTFTVGEGVLIPRPETEELCEIAINELSNKASAVVYDLCSGSGCIGISIKKAVPESKVILIEKSLDALKYLKANASNILGENELDIIHGDILDFDSFAHLEAADIIISNPPYIKSDELPCLQSEVQLEPKMALDGGEDGLVFYRALADFWATLINENGVMLLECGEEQAEDIIRIFSAAGYSAQAKKDFFGIDRMIVIRRK